MAKEHVHGPKCPNQQMDVETAWSLVCCNLCIEDKFACPRMPGYGYLRTHVAGTHIGHKHQGMDKYCMEK